MIVEYLIFKYDMKKLIAWILGRLNLGEFIFGWNNMMNLFDSVTINL